MDIRKAQSGIAKVAKEVVINVVHKESSKDVHVGNKLAELVHIGSVLTQEDRSDNSTGASRNDKMLDWLDWVKPSNSARLWEVVGSRHEGTNRAKDVTSFVVGHGASYCIDGGFDCSNHSNSGSGAIGNCNHGMDNRSCHCKKDCGME